MFMYKKTLSLILCFSMVGVNPILADEIIENYDSGRVRIANIMSNEETGIAAYNKKNIRYAETQNLDKDLNVEQIAEFFGCKTVIGKSFITETLKYPVTSQDRDSVLANRQNAIKALVENPDLKKEVEQFLTMAQQHEQEVIKLMSEYFMGKTCPELTQLELLKKQNSKMYPFVKFLTLNPTVKMVGSVVNFFGLAQGLVFTPLFGKAAYDCFQKGLMYQKLAGWTFYMGLSTAMIAYQVHLDCSTGSEKRLKMYSLNQMIDIAEKIEKLITEYGMKNQFNMSEIKDAQGVELIKGLQHGRYQDKHTKVFLTPLVHTFLYKVYQQEKHLAQMFACIAEMDAYNAIATKIIESKNEKNKFCFVTFVENEKPTINAESFWNVLVKDPISSNMSESKNVILTGPNAGGKTTTIRAILQNIVLGQSFGVAAAASFEVTMFDVIYSYLNISDDLLNGLSLFASEVKRAQDVLQRIKTLEPHKKFFFALDELFTGTVAEDGEFCAYNFIKRIATFEGIQFIYATHFAKLKELGKDNELCINYKVDAPTKNANNKLVYPFTLSQGANEARVALDLAREANLFE